jgi:two-component system, OmpR family, sensor histidine kinase KdpD
MRKLPRDLRDACVFCPRGNSPPAPVVIAVTLEAMDGGERSKGEPRQPRVPPLLARFTLGRPRRRVAGYLVATLGTFALAAVLVPFRDTLTPLSVGFGFLVVVVLAASLGGLGSGVAASVLGFLTFNFFFLPPYDTFVIERGEYVVVLFVFLGLSLLISALLARATERAEAAEAREEELRILQAFSAELAAAMPGPASYEAILSRLLDTFGFWSGCLYVQSTETRELRAQVSVGATAADLPARWEPTDHGQRAERLPLSVGGRNLGLLVLASDRPVLTPAESRVLRAFCDQFALVLERDRLLHAATEAEVFRQSDQVRRSLIAAVSHDLRSPLAAIKASVTDLLEEGTPHDPGAVRDALESIDRETDRLNALIANLLDMSRIEGGMLRPRIQTVDLAEIVSGNVDRVRRQHPRLTVSSTIGPDPTLLRADPMFLDRIVANLLDNAAKAAVDRGTEAIEVQARRDGDRTTVRVIDHGAGVAPDVREQLFFPFYQVGQRHPRLGTGLGLAIVKGFLSLMEGEVWIEETPGGGATFAFSLPTALLVEAT